MPVSAIQPKRSQAADGVRRNGAPMLGEENPYQHMDARVSDGLLHYVARGDGPPVILLHGMAASLHDWESLQPALSQAGYRAIAVDLLGHGDSAKPDAAQLYTYRHTYAALEDWIASLQDEPPFILVGHSLGGHLGLTYALRNPEKVRALALLDPFYSPAQLPLVLNWLKRRPSLGVKAIQVVPLAWIDTLLGWDPISAPHFSPKARWQIAVDYKRASPHILNLPSTVSDITPELGRVQAPCLVIWGEKDLTLRPDSFPNLVAALPNARGYPIPGSGHQPHIGNPELVNRLVLDFLGSL
ncbi:MAG: alpha/beta hydrolase [Anaerolineales bacterium]|nr:alpha/beta hydrolase [Anaerolineales bacterium]